MELRSVDVGELRTMCGRELGVSGWHLVTQEEVNRFADASHDHQWIHVDPERAARESPFGGPIAHGYYTLSLAPYLLAQAFAVTGVRLGVNYGLNRLRFSAPLKVGESVRMRVSLQKVEDVAGGVEAVLHAAWEVKNRSRPVCVAELVYRYYP